MGDEIELTLPVSGKKVILRNYTTRSDDYKAEIVLKQGVYNENTSVDGKLQTISKYPQINIANFSRSYVESLVKSIDGDNTNIPVRLDELKTQDYAAVEEEVDKIVADNSPKPKTVSTDSNADTEAK